MHSDVISICEDSPVLDAVEVMTKNKIGAVLVRGQFNKYTGILSERDYMTKVTVKGLKARETLVKDIMTKKYSSVKSDETIANCFLLMNKFGFRHLPVKHKTTGEVVGMV